MILVVKNLQASKGLFVDIDCLKIGHCVAAVYEGQRYPSLILEINWDQRDLLIKSIHNSGNDKNCFLWPPRDDISCSIHPHYWIYLSAKYCQKTWTKQLQNQCKIV